MNFANKVAIITGAGGGLGAAYAKLLASKGASVVVNNRYSPNMKFQKADVTVNGKFNDALYKYRDTHGWRNSDS